MSFCLKRTACLPLSLCHYVLKNTSVSPRPPVILSSRPPLLLLLSSCYSVFKNTLSPLSLCHSVFKTTPVSPRPSVILSSRPPLLLLLSSCYSVFKTTLSPFVIMSFCLKKYICLAPSLCYSVFKNYPVWLLILLHISCLRSAFLCCTFASSSGMKTVTGWASDDR